MIPTAFETARRSARWWQLQTEWPWLDRAALGLAPTPAQVMSTLGGVRLLRYAALTPQPPLPEGGGEKREKREASGNSALFSCPPSPLRRGGGGVRATLPLLLIPSLINRYYIFDLQSQRSLVEYLQGQGYDVWLVDWHAGAVDRYLTLEAAVTQYLPRLVRRIRRVTGAEWVSLLGYSIGGVLATLYTALYPDSVANLINLTGPVRYDGDGLFTTWTRPAHFDADLVAGAFGGNIPGWLMQAAFDSLVPAKNAIRARRLWERLDDEPALRRYLAVLYWLGDQVDFPGAFYTDVIRALYQEDRLLRGALTLGGRRVDLRAIRCPVLVVAADDDLIAPAAQVLPLVDAVGSADAVGTTVHAPGGHIFLVVGDQAPAALWGPLERWLRPRSQ